MIQFEQYKRKEYEKSINCSLNKWLYKRFFIIRCKNVARNGV